MPSSMCSDYVPRHAKTVEQDTESQDRDFEPNFSQMSWAEINTEEQLLRRDSNAPLPKPTPTERHQVLAASKQPGWISRMSMGLLPWAHVGRIFWTQNRFEKEFWIG